TSRDPPRRRDRKRRVEPGHSRNARAVGEILRRAHRPFASIAGRFSASPGKAECEGDRDRRRDGFKIENVVYEGGPGQWVTGNLYVPAKPPKSMAASLGLLVQAFGWG